MNESLNLPLDHLQLEQRAFNAAVATGCKTIGDVIDATLPGGLLAESAGEKTAKEIQAAILNLHSASGEGSNIDWQRFWEIRPIARHRLALTSSSLDRLDTDVRARPLGVLHLRKACSGLLTAGISNVGQLLDAAKAGIPKLENFGATAHKEVVYALTNLSRIVASDGSVDWCEYATLRGFTIIPENTNEEIVTPLLLQHLPGICEAVVTAQFNARAWQIFKRRLLADEDKQETLEALASVYGITRERVRQIEALCLEAIKKPLFEDDYYGLAFRLRPKLGEIFREARDHFESLGLPAWRESRWVEELKLLWSVPAAEINRFDRLISELLGYRRCHLRSGLEALILDAETPPKEVKRLSSAVEGIHEVLGDNNTGLDSFQLTRALQKAHRESRAIEEMPVLVELCCSAEKIADDLYRLQFPWLRGRGEQVFRLLSERGQPLHYVDVIRQINRQLPTEKRIRSKRNLTNQLAKDARLEPIGRSGKWALAQWNLETRSLVDVIDDVLARADEALSEDDIVQSVLNVRPGAESSVTMLLQFNPDRFRKVGPKMYALTSWGDEGDDETLWSKEKIADFVSAFFANRKGRAIEFAALNEAFMKASGLSNRSARGTLAHHPAVQIERLDHRTRIARFRPEWRSVTKVIAPWRTAPLQIHVIANRAVELLSDNPTGEMPLIDLVKRIESELNVVRPNIYSAISQSTELENVRVEGSAFKICRLRGATILRFPQIDQISDIAWREECTRAVAKLNVDDVDIALFMLGRQFDKALKEMLETARDYAGLPVAEGHLARIQNRIDWAVQRGIFGDKATLNLLRAERNERGHEPPKADERRAIMKFAPFLATLYLDYLLIVQQRIQSFRGLGAPFRQSNPVRL